MSDVLRRVIHTRSENLENGILEDRILADVNAEVDDLVYALSHDLGAPMRAIEGFARLLESEVGDQLPDGSREDLQRVLGASLRLRAMLADLLRFSRLTRHTLDVVPVDVAPIVGEVVADRRVALRDPPVEVVAPASAWVLADPALLTTALEELVVNAVRAVRRRGGPGKVEVRVDAAGSGRTVSVSDDGDGFDPRWREQVFQPFFRVDQAGDGAGMGLAIVRRAAHRHGGWISVDPGPGEGSSFHLHLPGTP